MLINIYASHLWSGTMLYFVIFNHGSGRSRIFILQVPCSTLLTKIRNIAFICGVTALQDQTNFLIGHSHLNPTSACDKPFRPGGNFQEAKIGSQSKNASCARGARRSMYCIGLSLGLRLHSSTYIERIPVHRPVPERFGFGERDRLLFTHYGNFVF